MSSHPSRLRAALRRNRGRVYTVLPLMPVEEAWHRAISRAATQAIQAREDAEVAGVLSAIGGPRSADVVTIIPTYERGELLQHAVASALAQDVDDHLIVTIHDGGTITRLPDDPRLLQLALSANFGIAGIVRNVGIRATNSRLVAFLDDDNTWLPNHLPLALAAHARPGVRFTYSDIGWFGPDGKDLGVLGRPFSRRQLAHENYIDINSVVAARSLDPTFSRVPRKKVSFTAEDWELTWRLSKQTPPLHVETVTVRYLVNPDSYFTDHARTLER